MIIQATKRNTIIAAILASIVILIATSNLIAFKLIDIEIKDFLEGFVVGICLVFITAWAISLIRKKQGKDDTESKDLAINKVYLSIGMLSLVIGSILSRAGLTDEWFQFVKGGLFIASIIFNIMYLVGLRKVRKG